MADVFTACSSVIAALAASAEAGTANDKLLLVPAVTGAALLLLATLQKANDSPGAGHVNASILCDMHHPEVTL